jgi:hypothetical protein
MRSNSGDIGKKDRHYPVFTVTKPYIRTIGPRKWPFPEFRLVHLAQLIQCVHGLVYPHGNGLYPTTRWDCRLPWREPQGQLLGQRTERDAVCISERGTTPWPALQNHPPGQDACAEPMIRTDASSRQGVTLLFTTLDPFASKRSKRGTAWSKKPTYTEERSYEGSRESRAGSIG